MALKPIDAVVGHAIVASTEIIVVERSISSRPTDFVEEPQKPVLLISAAPTSKALEPNGNARAFGPAPPPARPVKTAKEAERVNEVPEHARLRLVAHAVHGSTPTATPFTEAW